MPEQKNIMNNELWKKLKSSITKSDLVEISKYDYGYDAEAHYTALLNIYENRECTDTQSV